MNPKLLSLPRWCLLTLVSLIATLSASGVEQPPTVKAFVINGGDAQRSMVTSVAITFSADVGASLQVDDLHLTNLTTNAAVTAAQFTYKAATKTGTWTFPTQLGKSLPDGNYLAFILPADVVGPTGLQLVPNVGATSWSTKFHRYFGDFDGDRDVDFLDTAKMRKADMTARPNPNYNPAADVNGDGKVDDVDLAAFKAHYLTVLSGQVVAPVVVGAPVRTSQQTVTIGGTAPPNTRVTITNGFFTFEGISDANGNFSIMVGLLANRINSLFVAGEGFTATDLSSLTPVTITQDSTPPFLYVDSPSDASTVDTADVTVTGRVGDLLSGFTGLKVTVNQVNANITAGIGPNGTFQAPNIPLAMGENFLAIVATDVLGTSVTKSVMVTRVARLQMEIISGNDQSAVRNTELAAPLVVRIWDNNGQPFPNKIVSFQVTRSDGHVSPVQGQSALTGPMMAQARTDAQGLASIYWRLGSDSGQSNNLLTATSAGVPGEARFRASANPMPPTQINVGMGNNQIGEAGGIAPLPLTAWASDNLNGAPNVPVTYKVTSGDAQVTAKDQPNAAGSVVIPTDSTGHVDAYLHFGASGGPVTVEATFDGLQSNPAVFMARALVRKPGQPATFTAVVQDNTGLAIAGATCTLNVNGIKLPAVLSDDYGSFTIPNVNPGAGFIQVDGRTATKLGGKLFNQPGRFPSLVYRVTIVPNADNPLPTTVYLPTLNPVNERSFDGTKDVDLTIQGIAGLKMTIRAGSMTLADGTKPTAAQPVTVSLNQVHADNIPMPIQDGVAPLLTWTLQPPGAHFDPPVAIQYPNMTGLRPGSFTNFLSYNHDVERFEIVASGTVSSDGSVINSDPGVGLLNSGWGCNCPPYSVTGEVQCPFELTIDATNADLTQSRTAVIKGGSGGFTYSWTLNGAVFSTKSTFSLPAPLDDDRYIEVDTLLTVTDSDGDRKSAHSKVKFPVRILNSNKATISALKVAKMTDEGVISEPGDSAVLNIDKDSDRFYVCIAGAAKLGACSLDIATTDNPMEGYNDAPHTIDLTPSDSDLVSKSLLLVSNAIDDTYPVDGIVDNARNDRTLKVQLGGKVRLTNVSVQDVGKQTDLSWPVSVIKTVNVQLVVLLKDQAGKDAQLAALNDILTAQETFAQVGIALRYTIVSKEPPAGVITIGGLQGFKHNPFTGEDTFSQQEKNLLLSPVTTPEVGDIQVFYINYFTDAALRGESILASLLPQELVAMGDNAIVSSANRRPFTLAHELGHILLNSAKHPNELGKTNLMYGDGIFGGSVGNTVGATKRLTVSEEAIMLNSPHAH